MIEIGLAPLAAPTARGDTHSPRSSVSRWAIAP